MKYSIGDVVFTASNFGVITAVTRKLVQMYNDKNELTFKKEPCNYYTFGQSQNFIGEDEILGRLVVEVSK